LGQNGDVGVVAQNALETCPAGMLFVSLKYICMYMTVVSIM